MINSDYFFMSQAGHARALIRGWSALRRRSLLTDSGLDLLVEITVAVGKVNQMSAQVRTSRTCLWLTELTRVMVTTRLR